MSKIDDNKAVCISAIVYEWGAGTDGNISVKSVPAPYHELARVKVEIGGASVEVVAHDIIRAIKACSGNVYDDD